MARNIPQTLLLAVVAIASFGCGGGSSNLTVGTMPQGRSFQGVWMSPQYGNMHMCVTGSTVFGDYQKDERRGTIQGTVQGNLLRFQWEETREMVVGRPSTTRGRGYFHLTVDGDEDSRIIGEWGLDEEEAGSPWNGVMMRNRRPERCLNGGSSGGSEPADNGYDDSDSYDDGDYGDDSYDDSGSDDLSGLDEF